MRLRLPEWAFNCVTVVFECMPDGGSRVFIEGM